MGHAFYTDDTFRNKFVAPLERDFREILEQVYGHQTNYRSQDDTFNRQIERPMRALAHGIGTMKSAREGNVAIFREFLFELVAQYLTTGHITFNSLPNKLQVNNRKSWGHPRWDSTLHNRMRDEEDLEGWN